MEDYKGARSFGFAVPLDFVNVKKGMLVMVAPTEQQSYFGVVSKIRHEFILVTLSAADGATPGAIQLSNCSSDLWSVPGTLEIEPSGSPFARGPDITPREGFLMSKNGSLLALIWHWNEVNRKERYCIDLSTGEHVDPDGRSLQPGIKLFIRQEGRRERFEWPSLTPEQ